MRRRAFLKNSAIVAIPVIGGALSTSCETVNNPEIDDSWKADFEIMTEAARFEAATILTYQDAAAGVFVTDTSTPDEIKQTAALYSNHHAEHLALFNEKFAEHDVFPQILIGDSQPDDGLIGLTT